MFMKKSGSNLVTEGNTKIDVMSSETRSKRDYSLSSELVSCQVGADKDEIVFK
jgi:hypothetical protein